MYINYRDRIARARDYDVFIALAIRLPRLSRALLIEQVGRLASRY